MNDFSLPSPASRCFRGVHFLLSLGLLAVVSSPTSAAELGPAGPGFVGVSSVRDSFFHNEPLLFVQPQDNDQFATSLSSGDFNGDGVDDAVSGIPYDDGVTGSEVENGGAFMVSYGASPGGPGADIRFYSQIAAGSPDPDEPNDYFAFALAVGDFNADGRDDLAVSSPGHNEGEFDTPTGAVAVHYGSPSGLEGAASEWLVPRFTAGLENDPQSTSFECGGALAAGDLDGDGFDDLAIGCASTHIVVMGTSYSWAGAVFLLRGSAQGLVPVDAVQLSQEYGTIAGGAETSDNFGAALAAGNFDGDVYDDLAVGVPGENGTGAVAILFGDASLGFGHNEIWFQAQTGGADEAGDEFGSVLAAGDFDRDGFDDLVVGTPLEDFGSGFDAATESGAISVLYGSAGGIAIARSDYLQQSDLHGVGVVNQTGDHFGAALAASDFDGDGYSDLAVGHPGEDFAVADRGAVTVLMGKAGGFGATMRWNDLYPGQSGIGGEAQTGARFGASLSAGDLDGDGIGDLVVGSPFQNRNSLIDVGDALILFGSLFADGFDLLVGTELWSDVAP